MKLFEMQHRPKRAGKAQVMFSSTRTPTRIDDRIALPDNPDLEFYSLKDDEQFLARDHYGELWFGGTDEEPFLVRLNPDVFSHFMEQGEAGFYDALKPDDVKQLEERLSTPAKRQGDIFAVQLPLTWNEVASAMHLIYGFDAWQPDRAQRSSVFETRHRLTGTWACSMNLLGFVDVTLVEGTLIAPDHTPLQLAGLHWLSQAQHLHNAPEAD